MISIQLQNHTHQKKTKIVKIHAHLSKLLWKKRVATFYLDTV